MFFATISAAASEQVKRNLHRIPKDFMFTLTEKEFENLKSQNATSSWGGRRKLPSAFTEQGVAMLSSILNSDVAIEVSLGWSIGCIAKFFATIKL